jgi:hypothetical protein
VKKRVKGARGKRKDKGKRITTETWKKRRRKNEESIKAQREDARREHAR